RRYDAGHWFSPPGSNEFPFRGRGIRIPTLEEAFDAFPALRFNIELKAHSARLIANTAELVRRRAREDTVLLAAAHDGIMADLRAHLARTGIRPAVGASAGDVLAFIRSAIEGRPPPLGPMALQVPPALGDRPVVTPGFVAHAH